MIYTQVQNVVHLLNKTFPMHAYVASKGDIWAKSVWVILGEQKIEAHKVAVKNLFE